MQRDLSLQWDIFCRVIDNHGDLGVCLRVARQLVALGERVRLWVDDASALTWMANTAQERSWAHPWPTEAWNPPTPCHVVLETFGCHLPDQVERGLSSSPPLAWINLEYLSAEDWVERSHGLPSPIMSGPAKGLSKRFCYPGFTSRTGGLLHPLTDLGTAAKRAAPPAALGHLNLKSSERLVSLFCYPHAPLAALLERLSERDTHVLVAGGADAHSKVLSAWQELPEALQARLRISQLPWLRHDEYDQLLCLCDLNVVRGEDSFVRAQWAGKPFLWHIYAQEDGSHALKLEAFLNRWLDSRPEAEVLPWRNSWRAWNGLIAAETLASGKADGLDESGLEHASRWRLRLDGLPELSATLWSWARDNP